VGKSTIAYHVATRLKQLAYDVGLYDLDSRGTTSSWASERAYVPAYDLRTLQATAPDHDLVVWDTAPHPDSELRSELVRAADILVVVAQGDRDSMAAAADLTRALAEAGAKRLAVLFNAIHPTGKEGRECVQAAREEGLPALDTVVRRYSCYPQARWDGCAVIDRAYARADNAWNDIMAVTDDILALADDLPAPSERRNGKRV
jgi:cellulose biosynthesis protein BcsQ